MTHMPGLRVVKGSPSAVEEAAIGAAILAIWREEQAAAARARAPSPWVAAARAEGARRGADAAFGHPRAWWLSSRMVAVTLRSLRRGVSFAGRALPQPARLDATVDAQGHVLVGYADGWISSTSSGKPKGLARRGGPAGPASAFDGIA